MSTRVIICGGRDFSDKDLCFRTLDEILPGCADVEIVSGHAKGEDSFDEEYAALRSFPVKIFKADWKQYGRAAGPIRNRAMLAYALELTPLIIAFWTGESKDTKNMIDQARKAGAEVKVISIN